MSCSTWGLGGLDPECLQALPDVGGESIGASGSTEIRDIPRPERCFQKPLLEHSFPLKTPPPAASSFSPETCERNITASSGGTHRLSSFSALHGSALRGPSLPPSRLQAAWEAGEATDMQGPARLSGFLDLRVCTHLLFSKYVLITD